MSYAKKDCTFLHCLPRGSEVDDTVFRSKSSKVWLQALNRVHVIISSGGKMLNADVGDMIIVLNILNIRQPYLSTNDTS